MTGDYEKEKSRLTLELSDLIFRNNPLKSKVREEIKKINELWEKLLEL